MEDLYAWFDQIITNADGASFLAGLVAGLLWKRFAPAVRAFVAKTPMKIDDVVVSAADACLGSDIDRNKDLCAEELNKILSTEEINKLIQLRRAQIAASKAAGKA
jgi:hypothetical protein